MEAMKKVLMELDIAMEQITAEALRAYKAASELLKSKTIP
jgi:hypothetical protein